MSWDFLLCWSTGGKAADGFDLYYSVSNEIYSADGNAERYLFVIMLRHYHHQTQQNSDNILVGNSKRVLGSIRNKELLVLMAGNNHQHSSAPLASLFGKLSRRKLLPYTLHFHHISLKMKMSEKEKSKLQNNVNFLCALIWVRHDSWLHSTVHPPPTTHNLEITSMLNTPVKNHSYSGFLNIGSVLDHPDPKVVPRSGLGFLDSLKAVHFLKMIWFCFFWVEFPLQMLLFHGFGQNSSDYILQITHWRL